MNIQNNSCHDNIFMRKRYNLPLQGGEKINGRKRL